MVAEIKIENDLRSEALLELNITSIKLNLSGNRGWPDVQFLYAGRSFFMEVKRPGEVPTDLQAYRLHWLKDNGFPAMWTDDIDKGMEALRQWKLWIDGKGSPKSQWKPTTLTPCIK